MVKQYLAKVIRLLAAHRNGLAVECTCVLAIAWVFREWSKWAHASWKLQHEWLFTSELDLARDVHCVNAFVGVSLYIVLRTVFTPAPALFTGAASGLGFAALSEQKMQYLNLPVLPWDLKFIGDTGAFADFLNLERWHVRWVSAVVAVVVCGVVWRYRHTLFRRSRFVPASLLAAFIIGLWWNLVIKPITPRFLSGQMHNIAWDQSANYTNFGPFYTFLVNSKYASLPVPGNSASHAARTVDAGSDDHVRVSKDGPDVVMILSEAFTDLPVKVFGKPFTCMNDAPKSKMLSPSWGGLTANVESEVLTGYPNTVFPVGAIPFQMYFDRPIPHALPHVFRRNGYEVKALHSYDRNFFSRPKAYEMLGFESFIGEQDLYQPARRGQYVDDQVVFDELLRLLETPTGKPKFLHAVTMMAHTPYQWPGRYPIRPELQARLPRALKHYEIPLSLYGSMVYDHEEMFCQFLSKLAKRPRKTLVVFYGDHYPTFGSMVIYKSIHKAIQGHTPLNVAADYSKTPLAVFDSTKGFVALPAQVPAYNIGALLLKEVGLQTTGLWAMPHKMKNALLTNQVYVSNHQKSMVDGDDISLQTDEKRELEILGAHAYQLLISPGR